MQNETRLLPLERAVHKGMRSSLLGIASNLVLAVFKCVAGVLGHSFALVADGIESSSDVVSSLVVFLGLKFSISLQTRTTLRDMAKLSRLRR